MNESWAQLQESKEFSAKIPLHVQWTKKILDRYDLAMAGARVYVTDLKGRTMSTEEFEEQQRRPELVLHDDNVDQATKLSAKESLSAVMRGFP